jgi:hypothetical protein
LTPKGGIIPHTGGISVSRGTVTII